MIRFETFERVTLRGKRWFFRIVASGNNEVLAQSQTYKAARDRDIAIGRIRHGAGDGPCREGKR